jgi:hypothetical protein
MKLPSKEFIVLNGIVFGAIYALFRNVSYQYIFISFFISGVVQTLWASGQLFFLFPSYNINFQCTGYFNNLGVLACFLLFSTIGGIWILLHLKKDKYMAKVFVLLALLLIIFVLIKANSRASYIALLLGMVCLFVYLTQIMVILTPMVEGEVQIRMRMAILNLRKILWN